MGGVALRVRIIMRGSRTGVFRRIGGGWAGATPPGFRNDRAAASADPVAAGHVRASERGDDDEERISPAGAGRHVRPSSRDDPLRGYRCATGAGPALFPSLEPGEPVYIWSDRQPGNCSCQLIGDHAVLEASEEAWLTANSGGPRSSASSPPAH